MRFSLRHSCLLVVVGLAAVAGCFPLDRVTPLTPGTVRGNAVRPDVDGRPGAAFVRVTGVGSNLVRSGDDGGFFVVGGLSPGRLDLRFVDDVDGDGWPDRGREIAMHFGENGGAVDGIELGTLDLDGTFGVRGTAGVKDDIVVAPGALVARVYALRARCSDVNGILPIDVGDGACADSGIERLAHGIEGEAAADAAGDWQLTRLIAGAIEVVGVLYEQNTDGTLGAVVDVSGPFVIDGTALDENAPPRTDGPQLIFDDVPPAAVDVTVLLSSAVGADAFAVFSRRGDLVGSCAEARDVAATVADARVVEIDNGSDALVVPAVFAGVWDVVVCDDNRRGATTSQLAIAGTDLRWPVVMLETDPCPLSPDLNDADARDCDGDSRPGLPLARFEALRGACAAQCLDQNAPLSALGAAIAERTCTVDDVVYDCDDDSDGQADVTEPIACIGPGRGTDLDGDGLCSIVDAFPNCAENDPAVCVAGREQLTPRVPDDGTPDDELEGDFGRVSAVVFDVGLAGGGAVLAMSALSVPTTTPTALAFVGIVSGDTLLDDLPVYDVDGFVALDTTSWSGGRTAPRLDFAAAGTTIFGGASRFCPGDAVSCGSDDVQERIFGDRIDFTLGEDNRLSLGVGAITTPRTAAAAGTVGGAFVVAGGLTCAGPRDGLTVSCRPAERIVTGSVELVRADGSILTNELRVPRHGAGVVAFADSTVQMQALVIGGNTSADGLAATASVEVFQQQDGALALIEDLVDPLQVPRAGHATTAIIDDDDSSDVVVVVSGGLGAAADSFEVWHAGTRNWQQGRLKTRRAQHAAVVLSDGRVLLIGGVNPTTNTPLSSTELIDPREQQGRLRDGEPARLLLTPRRRPAVAEIAPDRFVIAGGFDANDNVVVTEELFEVGEGEGEGELEDAPACLSTASVAAFEVVSESASSVLLATTGGLVHANRVDGSPSSAVFGEPSVRHLVVNGNAIAGITDDNALFVAQNDTSLNLNAVAQEFSPATVVAVAFATNSLLVVATSDGALRVISIGALAAPHTLGGRRRADKPGSGLCSGVAQRLW